MRKNSFLTVLFAFIPGAGPMYLGYMKRGISLMGVFFGILAICTLLRIDSILWALPIVWFYSFFTTLNIHGLIVRSMPIPKDEYPFDTTKVQGAFADTLSSKKGIYLGYTLIVIGVIMMINLLFASVINLLNSYFPQLSGLFYRLREGFPTLIIAVIIIVLGTKLVRSGKQMDEQTVIDVGLVEYEGKSEE